MYKFMWISGLSGFGPLALEGPIWVGAPTADVTGELSERTWGE